MNTQVIFKVSHEERKKIQKVAEIQHLSVSAFLRRIALIEFDKLSDNQKEAQSV